jgi:signal transduction histidine kinase/ActR/RegA family two-component response regulator
MNDERPEQLEMRVLVLAPTARDAATSRDLFEAAGIRCFTCNSIEDVCREAGRGAGAAVVTVEAVLGDKDGRVAGWLKAQPPWSDFPLVVLTPPGVESPKLLGALDAIGHMTLMKRPVQISTLVSTARSALRDRQRQYAVRDHLAERERQTDALRDKEERLQFALAAGRLGSWEVDLGTGRMDCSALCRENFGRPPGEPFSYQDLFEVIHPDDRGRVREAVRRAIDDRTDYDIQYRNIWPGGATHWVLVRGRATYGPDGSPLRMSGVSLDMTEWKRVERQLLEADRRKDEFLALLAHELRNPLAPLRNGLQVMRLAPDDREAVRSSREIMDRQLTHMVRLIDDLLDVSRISQNKMELRRSRVLLADVVGSAVEAARPFIEAAGHELTVSLPPEPVFLDADLTRLAQVFSNLLTNSAKYTERGGRIWLSAERRDGEAVVSVRDTGIGIPADDLPHIFDMFSQVDRSIERSTGGLGIGLALVKGLVEMHGGTVTVESGGQSGGSTFTVRLPVLESRPEPVVSTPENGQAVRGPKRSILVVDDNRDSATSMAMMLKLMGNEVHTAHDGVAAVEAAEQFRPNVVLMDVGMPKLNGLDATRRIREQPWGRSVVIIALTGWGQDGDHAQSKEAGCDGHLVKPVSFPDLEQLLAELTGEHSSRKQPGSAR